MMTETSSLHEEALFIHVQIFGPVLNQRAIKKYCLAHEQWPSLKCEKTSQNLVHIKNKKRNLSAIEYYARMHNPDNRITKKILTLTYILECYPEYNHLFFSERDQQGLTLLITIRSLFSSLLFYLIGWYSWEPYYGR